MDRFEAMSMLVTVVDQGSLSAASRHLRVPLPTLSRKISDLEKHLGAKLLVRTTRRLALTDAGAAYVTVARRIIDQMGEAEREAAGEFMEPKGELVLTAPILFGRLHVLPIVADFLAQFAQIDIRLVLSDRNAHLVDDHIDMAVRIGALADSAMIATRVGSMRMVVCAGPALLEQYGVPKKPDDLARMPVVGFDMPAPASTWQFPAPGSVERITVPIVPRLTVSTAEAAADAAIRDVGVTRLMFYQVAAAVAAGRLRIVLQTFEPAPAPIHLVHAGRGQMPLKMRRFLDFAAPRLRDTLERLDPSAELVT